MRGAAGYEQGVISAAFCQVKLVVWWELMFNRRINAWMYLYNHLEYYMSFVMFLPSYTTGQITLGTMFQLAGLVQNTLETFEFIGRVYGQIRHLRALTDRLLGFERAIASAKAQADGCIATKKLHPVGCKQQSLIAVFHDITSPSGHQLWAKIRFELSCGQKILISGNEGSGKSTLIRTLRGIWPFVGSGTLVLPETDFDSFLFVPQKVVIPLRCSLADALAYPKDGAFYTSEELLQALVAVQLEGILTRGGRDEAKHDGPQLQSNAKEGLGCVENWSQVLSPGMLQRLMIAHIILKLPRFLFLDEAMASLSSEAVVDLYSMLSSRLPTDATIVHISHDVSTMEPLHDSHLAIDGKGYLKKLVVLKGQRSRQKEG
eukprot:gnl/TRDRNA2_/TRDRNA2_128568_c2_seq2.p1 gnl/TRDRNA2_/TRDRNA2_128568_c2~~gnl/TRDRNA2_/TRDRNA2_128568_c2_seq2.p1  ORF type:complete len:412 (-),score=48.91 gnl/TRDRNA2_/TRDRNA2_128568_c2_seq2:166-1290(-)